MVKGLSQTGGQRLVDYRQRLKGSGSALTDLKALMRNVALPSNELEALAEAGAFERLQAGRRQALWTLRAPQQLGLFKDVDIVEPSVMLPPLHPVETLGLDYQRVRLSIDDHPLRHLRQELNASGVITARDLLRHRTGDRVSVAGLVLARQRPGTASGVVFITLEDETGVINLILYSRVFEAFRPVTQHSALMIARGKIERQDPPPRSLDHRDPRQKSGIASIIHVLVESVERLNAPGAPLAHQSRDFR
jgi:error-prone DNA polymerase